MAKYIQSLALLRNCLFVGLLLTLLIDSERASAQFQELKSEIESLKDMIEDLREG